MTAALGTINSTDVVEAITNAQYLDTTHTPAALYEFDGDLVDSSGNGLDLSMGTGTAIYGPAPVTDGLGAFFQASRAQRGSFDASLQILTALTLEAMVFPGAVHSADAYIASFNGSGDTEAVNILYNMMLTSGNRLRYLHEAGAGVDHGITFNVSIPLGQWSHLAITRDSAGTGINAYVNGILRGSTTLGAAPTGGGSSQLQVGQFIGGTFPFTGMLSSVKIIAAELNATQVLAEANRALPPELRP